MFVSAALPSFIHPVMHSDLLSTLVSHIQELKKKRCKHLLPRREESVVETPTPLVVSGGDPFLKSVFFVGGCCIPSEKIVDSHPQRQKDPVISHFIQRRSSHLLTGGASRKYSFYSPSVRIPFSAHETLQTLLPKEKIQHLRIIRARHRHAEISMQVSLVISASQILVPFFLNPPRTGWGWGDRSQIPPFFPPLDCGEKIRSLVLRSMPPHKLRLLRSPES